MTDHYDCNPPVPVQAMPVIVTGVGLGFSNDVRYVSIFLQHQNEGDKFIVCMSKEQAEKCVDLTTQALGQIDEVDTDYYRRN